MTKYIDIGTVGDYLREEWLEPLGLSCNKVAMSIGVPANRITDIVNGRRGITADTDLRLCRYFKMSDGHFINMQMYIERTIAKRSLKKELAKIVPHSRVAANDNRAEKELMAM